MKKITTICLLFLLMACGNSKKEDQLEKTVSVTRKSQSIDSIAKKFARRTEQVHQKEIFQEKGMVQFRMQIDFREKEKMEQRVRIATDSTLIRVDHKAQTSIFNGTKQYDSAKDSTSIQTNFNLATLFGFAFTLSDPNKKWDAVTFNVSDENIRALKFTYHERPALMPSPWYVVYSDKRTDLLKALAFRDPDLNNGKPIAVQFEKYITVKSVPIATFWKIYSWDATTGIGNELLGSIKISDISFSPFEETVFEIVNRMNK